MVLLRPGQVLQGHIELVLGILKRLLVAKGGEAVMGLKQQKRLGGWRAKVSRWQEAQGQQHATPCR